MPSTIPVLNHPWTEDDHVWFEENPERSHRARLPFPGELDNKLAKIPAPAGHTLITLVRQVEPGSRLKSESYLADELLPALDDEAIIHTLFEISTGNEPVPPNWPALAALIAKYSTRGRA